MHEQPKWQSSSNVGSAALPCASLQPKENILFQVGWNMFPLMQGQKKKKKKKGNRFDLSTESQQFASICVLAPCSSPVEVLASASTQWIYGAQIQLIIAFTEQDVFSAFPQCRGQGRLTQQEQCLLSRQNTPSI